MTCLATSSSRRPLSAEGGPEAGACGGASSLADLGRGRVRSGAFGEAPLGRRRAESEPLWRESASSRPAARPRRPSARSGRPSARLGRRRADSRRSPRGPGELTPPSPPAREGRRPPSLVGRRPVDPSSPFRPGPRSPPNSGADTSSSTVLDASTTWGIVGRRASRAQAEPAAQARDWLHRPP